MTDVARRSDASIPLPRARADVIPQLYPTWAQQVGQYPKKGKPGFGYLAGDDDRWPGARIDCLFFRNMKGDLIGILNHYPHDLPPFEKAGNVNVWVRPDRLRRGIGRKLLVEALRRWPTIDLSTQMFTPAGLELARAVLSELDD